MVTWVVYACEASKRSFSLRRVTYDVAEEITGWDVESVAEEGLVERSVLVPSVVLVDSPPLGPAR